MKLEEVFQSYSDFIMPTYAKTPLVFVKGKGSFLWDIHSKKYLDFFPGWGVGSMGHCHAKVVQAIREQAAKLIFVPNNYYTLAQAKLAKKLVSLAFPSKVFFCNSGAEANEAAIKFSRKFGNGRYEIITFQDSFHGRTAGALAATGQKKYQEGFQPLLSGFKLAQFNNLDSVKSLINPDTVAIMLELIQGEGGVNVAGLDFIKALREICDQNKLLLIVDEVQTGIGRTGKFFAYQHYGIIPDIITLAKALGAGLPIGAMLVKKEIADILTSGTHASTFGGGAVVCASSLAVLKAMRDEDILSNVRDAGEYLFEMAFKLKEKYNIIQDVRGRGLMLGIQLKCPGKDIVAKCMQKGLLINCTHDTVLRLMPALNVTKKQIGQGMRILEDVIKKAKS
ncbi:MAG: aspartate aminotransferase family protein [Candidatus Omnitrophica bacterium]|jgi:acetylornithine/N-succinyldiaminopimelate aminotransferase|nr:aspartate aminotransferase family protein [Candidatus Omnitrophota bacterium]